jgi:protein tyrosine/serine phosphatase
VLASSRAPSDVDARRFLKLVTDPARQPVNFHCWRGKDRTGVMCATYRMAVEHWTLAGALAEMYAFGFYRGWHDLHAYVESLPVRLDTLTR